MKHFWEKNEYIKWGLTAFLVIVGSILFYLFLLHGGMVMHALGSLLRILSPIIWGLVIAYILWPMTKNAVSPHLIYSFFSQKCFMIRSILRAFGPFILILLFFPRTVNRAAGPFPVNLHNYENLNQIDRMRLVNIIC